MWRYGVLGFAIGALHAAALRFAILSMGEDAGPVVILWTGAGLPVMAWTLAALAERTGFLSTETEAARG